MTKDEFVLLQLQYHQSAKSLKGKHPIKYIL